MDEIHELFVLALFLVWFAGATPECDGYLLTFTYFRAVKGALKEAPTAALAHCHGVSEGGNPVNDRSKDKLDKKPEPISGGLASQNDQYQV